MTDLNSIDYYMTREQRELKLAAAATDPGIATIHRQMAQHYAQVIAECRAVLARQEARTPPAMPMQQRASN